MTYETEQALRDEIALLHDTILCMAEPLLTPTENGVLKCALAGRSMQSVAAKFRIQRSNVFKIANKLRRLGVALPNWPNHLKKKPSPPRFHARGVTPEGCPISCAAETQAAADDHIAAQAVP